MRTLDQAGLVAGKGLEGDRYFVQSGSWSRSPGPGRQVTLIEIEAIEALERESGTKLEPPQARRNLITRGVPLNHLVGARFRIGPALLEGVRLCEPCDTLESLTKPGIKKGLAHRGGLRADIVEGGVIRVGDEISDIIADVE